MTWVIAGFATAGALIDDNPIEGALKGAALAYGGGQLLAAGGTAGAAQAGTTAATAAGTAVPTAATGAGATSTGLLAPSANLATEQAALGGLTNAPITYLNPADPLLAAEQATTSANILADPFGVDATLMQNQGTTFIPPNSTASVNPGSSLTQQGFESNLLQNNPNVSTTPGFKEKLQMGLLQQAPAFLPKQKPAPAPASSGPSLRVPPIAGPENLYLRFNRRKR